MSGTVLEERTAAPEASDQGHRSPVLRRALLGVLALLVLIAAAFAGSAALSPRTPLDGSADAGFARDMAAHHEQAVEMAEIVRDRTDDDTIRVIATDVSLTQTAQIGMMQGWLALWGLPVASAGPRMAWMTGDEHGGMQHEQASSMGGTMPGLASRADIARLRTLPTAQADRLFLRLMIAHHRGGVQMAEAGERLAGTPEVRDFARRIATSQQAEIQQMQALLR